MNVLSPDDPLIRLCSGQYDTICQRQFEFITDFSGLESKFGSQRYNQPLMHNGCRLQSRIFSSLLKNTFKNL